MHELNVLMAAADQVEQIAIENHLKLIDAIVLEVGELSSIVPMFLTEYYPMIVEKKPVLCNSKLIIEKVPGIARCLSCGTDFNVVENEGYCPKCNSFEKEVISGQDFVIKEIRINLGNTDA